MKNQLLIRPDYSELASRAVGCAMRSIQTIGSHGAPYRFMDKSGRINKPRLKAGMKATRPAALSPDLSSRYNPRALLASKWCDRILGKIMLFEASFLFIFRIA